MAENRVKDFINTVDLVKEQMIQKKEISTIAVAVKLEGLDQVNEELDKMLNKLEKANSLADELTSKLKNELDIDCSKVANLVSKTIHGKPSEARIDPDELKVLAKPLQEYLTSHFNPMCSVVVDVDRVTVVGKELSTPTD